MGILELENVSLVLNNQAILDGITLDIWEGHIHAVVGPNGAGKTTLAAVIMGLKGYEHFGGEIRFDGQSLRGMSVSDRAKAGITMGWQEPARFEGLTVRQFLNASSRNGKDSEIEEAMAQVGLRPEVYLSRAVDRTLSGGERKKVELASILVMKPRLLLLDEPDSGIDVASLENIFNALKQLKRNGATVLLITHSNAVLRQAEHAFLMCCGRQIMKGDIEKILPYFEGECIPCDHKNRPLVETEVPGL
ncbi:MAG: ABC transporter ATP-binding protein [Spirochaetales bacterium]|nr:ABC transporter ATP-binding protein [Spirochaetales bacterium]